MWQVIAVIGIGVGFLGLWLWMHRRLAVAQQLIREQMQASFKAMSFDVLEQSAQSFLQLAKTHLEKYQEGAKVDLEGRQKAIEVSLEPLKAAIKQLDEHHRELE